MIYVVMAKNCDGYRAPMGAFTVKDELEEWLKTARKNYGQSYMFYVLEYVDGIPNPKLALGVDIK